MPGTVYPSDAPRPTESEAEKAVWKALKARLPNGWRAFHSVRIRDRFNILAEGDFVLAHPERGLLALEVKGGQLKLEGGRWLSNGTPLDKAPLTQALNFVTKLTRRLDEWGCQPPAWGAAVAFPDTDFDNQPSADDLKNVVLGRNHLAWLDEFLPGVVAKALPAPQTARGDWMRRLEELWGREWPPALSLGTRIDQARERRLHLADEQLTVLASLEETDRVLIQGGAGTGKTLLAAEAARREAAAGKKVLIVCFTQPLCKWLGARLAGSGIEVQTVSGLAKRLAEEADGSWGALDLTDSELWKRYYERAADVCQKRWDAIIVDEAQDLLFEAWYFVRELAEGKRLWAFHDPGQAFWPDRAPPPDLFPARFKLTRGQRSPTGIQALANGYLGQPVEAAALKRAAEDRSLQLIACPDASKTADKVGAEIDKLIAEGAKPGDIGVVSLRGQTAGGAVYQAQRLGKHTFVPADAEGMEDKLVADSFLRWKGLERPLIIVADVDHALTRFGTRMHIALTRALTGVRVVAPGPNGTTAWPGLSPEL